jgi:hypothetical protein
LILNKTGYICGRLTFFLRTSPLQSRGGPYISVSLRRLFACRPVTYDKAISQQATFTSKLSNVWHRNSKVRFANRI